MRCFRVEARRAWGEHRVGSAAGCLKREKWGSERYKERRSAYRFRKKGKERRKKKAGEQKKKRVLFCRCDKAVALHFSLNFIPNYSLPFFLLKPFFPPKLTQLAFFQRCPAASFPSSSSPSLLAHNRPWPHLVGNANERKKSKRWRDSGEKRRTTKKRRKNERKRGARGARKSSLSFSRTPPFLSFSPSLFSLMLLCRKVESNE